MNQNSLFWDHNRTGLRVEIIGRPSPPTSAQHPFFTICFFFCCVRWVAHGQPFFTPAYHCPAAHWWNPQNPSSVPTTWQKMFYAIPIESGENNPEAISDAAYSNQPLICFLLQLQRSRKHQKKKQEGMLICCDWLRIHLGRRQITSQWRTMCWSR